MLRYREIPLLIISCLFLQPFTKLIVLCFTRYSRRTNCFILPTHLYRDLLIRGVASLVKGINFDMFFCCIQVLLDFHQGEYNDSFVLLQSLIATFQVVGFCILSMENKVINKQFLNVVYSLLVTNNLALSIFCWLIFACLVLDVYFN